MPLRRDELLGSDLAIKRKARAVRAFGALLEPFAVVLLPRMVEHADAGVRRLANAGASPQVIFHVLVGFSDGALTDVESVRDLLDVEVTTPYVLASREEIVVAADFEQTLDAAFADKRNLAVLVVAAEGACVVLEFGTAERAVVAPGSD